MGKIQLHTREQKLIFAEISESDFLKSHFYFTGGTALSAVYLHHRESDDLDFFSTQKFDNQIIFTLISEWSRKHQYTFTANFIEVVYVFLLTFASKAELKVDFSYYPYKKLAKDRVIDGIAIDSLVDIATNKLLTITQRTEVKDFVDLYYLLQEFSLWDLREGVKRKFHLDIDPLLLAADLLKVESFQTMPKMLLPLQLADLQTFFQKQAKSLGLQIMQ